MTLDQLRIFVAVAERQHVTLAARSINLAQSAVSHAIATLEARHDVRLFDRVGRRITLTEAGQTLLVEARGILAHVEQVEQALDAFGQLERGRIRVAASQTIGGYWLPRHLVAFRQAYPGVAISLLMGNTAQVVEAVETGTADLGFIEGLIRSELLTSSAVARDRIVLVTAPDHPWAMDGTDLPDVAALRACVWVMREPGSGTRSALEKALAELGLSASELRIGMELPSNEAVRGAVEAGLGVAALSASVVASSLETGLLHQVRTDLPDRHFHVVRHRERQSRAADALLRFARGVNPVGG